MAADLSEKTLDSGYVQSGDSEAEEKRLVVFYDGEHVCVEKCCVDEDGNVSFHRGTYEWIRREDLEFMTVYGRIIPK